MTDSIILVDAHVHIHPGCNLQLLLDSAAANFTDAALTLGARRWHGALLLTEMSGMDWHAQVPSEGITAGKWSVRRDPQDEATLLASREGRCIPIIAGRQIVTREGIEVLALGTRTGIADGLSLEATLAASIGKSALTVLPWAVGKWLGERGRHISEAVLMRRASIFVGDNGGRPWLWSTPRQFVTAASYGSQMLSGSDPLPLPGDESRVGSFGSWIRGALPETAPGRYLLQALRTLQPLQLQQYGALQEASLFLRNQIGLRLRARPPSAPRVEGAPETPDIETSSAGYARRFSGAAGRYLLQVQSQSIRTALRGLPPGKALDVGGGHGQLVDLLRDLGWQVTVHGTDPVCGENLRELHGKRDCAFLQGDLFALPVADQSFDLVIAVRLISHVEEWPRLVAELCRVSKHAVVIDYPAKGALNALTPLLFGLKKSLEGNTRTYTSFSKAELRAQFALHDFNCLTQVKQFLMPMVVHRVGKGSLPLRLAESVFRMLGLTALFGSPVILRVDRRMKVLLVAPQPFYQERGTPIAVRLLVETLCSFGHEVDLLVYHEGVDVQIPGARLIRAGRPPGIRQVPIGISPQKLVCDVWLISKMLGLMRRNRYDVIHAVEEAVFPAAMVAGRAGAKLVYDMDSSLSGQLTDKWRAMRPLRGLFESIERFAVRRAALVIAVCEDLAAKVRPWAGAERVIVLPDVPMGDAQTGAPHESLRALVGPDAVIGLYVGNLERYQGIDLLLQAMARVPAASPLRLIVIGGSAAHVEKYQQLVNSLGLVQRVMLLGARPVAQLGAYLAQSDVLVSPRTMGQNTPMKVYSYMQSGKAIVATDIRSHTQALDAGCAQLVDTEPAAMAAGLVAVSADPALRARLGMAARDKAESEYSLPVFTAKLRAAYERLQNS